MKQLTEYWLESFDWRKQERLLNQYPHFKTRIDISSSTTSSAEDHVMVHFIHVKSNAKNAIPLLLIHGWPGSVFEFYKVIEPLTSKYLILYRDLNNILITFLFY
jgi:hypothetical protein